MIFQQASPHNTNPESWKEKNFSGTCPYFTCWKIVEAACQLIVSQELFLVFMLSVVKHVKRLHPTCQSAVKVFFPSKNILSTLAITWVCRSWFGINYMQLPLTGSQLTCSNITMELISDWQSSFSLHITCNIWYIITMFCRVPLSLLQAEREISIHSRRIHYHYCNTSKCGHVYSTSCKMSERLKSP